MIDIDELERLAKAATPGPWKPMIMKSELHHFFLPPDYPHSPVIGQAKMDYDTSYIVAACNVVPKLIECIRELEKSNKEGWLLADEKIREVTDLKNKIEWLETELAYYWERYLNEEIHRHFQESL